MDSVRATWAQVFPQLVDPPTPAKVPSRSVKFNETEWKDAAALEFKGNKIFTAKYNVFSFLPKFLFEQFMRLANFYFLVVSVIQMSSVNLAPTGQYYTFIPLVIILALTALKELFEDYRRHKQDAETNAKLIEVLSGSVMVKKPWKDLVVGDIVRVHSEEPFPADLFLISSSDSEAVCYIETSNLDGETNLKIKQGIPELHSAQGLAQIRSLKGHVECEGPNNRLYNFDGTYHAQDKTQIPLGPNQILLRGSMLRNTDYVYGLVIYTGHDTKLLMNASATPIKKSRLERMVNKQITAIFALLFTMAIVCVIGYVVWNNEFADQSWYIDLEVGTGLQNFTQFIVFIILFNTVVPISLYVTVEFVKLVQALFINVDKEMYDPVSKTYAVARTSNLNEELGQIQFVFSDKTGTLTRNQMQFRKCSIGGESYGKGFTDSYRAEMAREKKILPDEPVVADADAFWNFYDPSLLLNLMDHHRTDSVIREFLTLLAVCHTVIPERDKNDDNKIVYQASSPDEAALVHAAKKLGFFFQARKPDAVKIMAVEKEMSFELLNVIEFSSARKRMSVIVRDPTNKIKLYCKGADTVILERLSKFQPFLENTEKHLNSFAKEGLRTLVLAVRELSESEYAKWAEEFHKASTTLVDRTEEMERVSELIEKELTLLGATAIEDKLQDGVPDAVNQLLEANIRVWMLTGDKKETAINIGYCCQLINESMTLLICDEESDKAVAAWAQAQLELYKGKDIPIALVVDGKTLTHALESPEAKDKILQLAIMCKSCICCRVSPIQKATMIALVRESLNVVTLAIGDGANDVSMIQTADVGVGITGLEGLQAARAADYTIAQFKFLAPLLFVHGAWSYRRLSKVILFSFYKTLTLYLVSFYFSFNNGFSGQVPWDKLSNALWNVIFTVLPPVCLGLFDQELSRYTVMKHPQLYASGQRNDFFNLKVFFQWFVTSIWHSLLVYLMVEIALYTEVTIIGGGSNDLWINGTVLYACILLTVSLKFALTITYWPWPVFVVLFGSLAIYMLELAVTGFKFITFYSDAQALYTIFPRIFSHAFFYFTILLVPVMCLLIDYSIQFIDREYFTQDWHAAQELWRLFELYQYGPEPSELESGNGTPLPTIPSNKNPLLATDDDPSAYRKMSNQSSMGYPVDETSPLTEAPTSKKSMLRKAHAQRSGYAFSQVEPDESAVPGKSASLTATSILSKFDSDHAKHDGS